MRQIQTKNSNFKYRHMILLDNRCSIKNPLLDPESDSAKLARTLCDEFSQKTADLSPFGFEQDRGYFFVSNSNCPHINPVKHGHVARVVDWPHSAFHRYVKNGVLAANWAFATLEGEFGEE